MVGCCGAGKTVLANRLGAVLDLPVTHLDHHYWQPGWQPTDEATWRRRVEELAAAERWVLDGNYAGTMDLRLPLADLVVVVDYPRRVYLTRALRRWARYRGTAHNVPGCPERVDRQFLRYMWRWPYEGRPRMLRLVTRYAGAEAVVALPSPAATRRWLASLAMERGRIRSGEQGRRR